VGQRSKISRLPPEIRDALEKAIIDRDFSEYEQLEIWLTEQGFPVGKSSIHRHGTQLERKIASIKASTAAARAIVEAAPDEQDNMSAAVMRMVQDQLFGIMVALKDAEGAEPAEAAKMLARIAESLAALSRASIAQKKFATEVKQRAEAAASAAEKIASKGGLSADAVAAIRSSILGIAA
jgi:hypothetical protein